LTRLLSKPVVGWIAYDFANSAFATTVLAVIFNRYFAEVVAGGSTGSSVHFLFWEWRLPGATIWSYVVSISTALVALSSPLLGAIADSAGWKKRLLVLYCYFGVLSTCGLIFVQQGDVALGAALFIGANFGFAGGNVFYNAFLLDISDRSSYGRISGAAWGIGYIGGGLCLVLNLIMLQKPEWLGFEAGTFGVGECVLVAGLWWGLFALPTVFWLKEKSPRRERLQVFKLARTGWSRILSTFRQMRRYKHLTRFLLAYILFNDGIETIIVMASIFGAEVVGLNAAELIVFFLVIQGTAFVGAFIFGWLADIIGNKRTLIITLTVWLGIVVWAYFLGWLVNLKTDYYIMGILAGIVMGGSQAAARSMQALFTPEQKAAEFFGFFALSGKVAGIFGPLIYGTAIAITGDVQRGILAVGMFFLVGLSILLTVNERKGIQTAQENIADF